MVYDPIMKYKVQQLNLATREIGTILQTDDLAVALAKMNRPGSCYRRVVERKGKLWKSGFRVIANIEAAAIR